MMINDDNNNNNNYNYNHYHNHVLLLLPLLLIIIICYRCLWKKHSFYPSLCPATQRKKHRITAVLCIIPVSVNNKSFYPSLRPAIQRKKLLSSPWFAAPRAYFPQGLLFRRNVFVHRFRYLSTHSSPSPKGGSGKGGSYILPTNNPTINQKSHLSHLKVTLFPDPPLRDGESEQHAITQIEAPRRACIGRVSLGRVLNGGILIK